MALVLTLQLLAEVDDAAVEVDVTPRESEELARSKSERQAATTRPALGF